MHIVSIDGEAQYHIENNLSGYLIAILNLSL